MSAVSIQQIAAGTIRADVITAGAITAGQIKSPLDLDLHLYNSSLSCERCGMTHKEICRQDFPPCISALEAAAKAAYELTSSGDAEAAP